MQDLKTRDQMAGVENTGLENLGSNLEGWKTQDRRLWNAKCIRKSCMRDCEIQLIHVKFGNPAPCPTVQVADGLVEVVDSFVYLGSMIDSSGGSRGEILRRIGLARTCMQQLEKRIWKSGIRLYQTYIVPVMLYGCETWTTTKYLCARLDAFDMWALARF